MLRKIESAQRHVRILNFKKTGLGTPVLGGMDALHATIVDNGVGSYSIVPKVAFAEAPSVQVTPVTADGICSLGTVTASSIQVLTKDLGLSPVYAVATLDLTADIVLTKKDAGDFANGHTLTLQVAAAAANPGATVLAVFSGNESAVVCTITPNDGTNNAATPVTVTTANLVQLINTGLITGKTPTITDALSLRSKITATGGGATPLADAGEGDAVVATFAGGSDIIAQAAKEMDFHVTIFGTDAKDRT
jgi:hypothetical protein